MPTIYLGSFSKRRNSTKQPTTELSDSRTVTLKANTSYDSPTFVLTGNHLDYNYVKWDNRYYFITDTRSIHNDLMEVDCVLDVLATYKAEIISSTQYVSYSSHNTSVWLPDMRIPVLSSEQTAVASQDLNFLDTDGFYVLSVVGYESAATYRVNLTNLRDIIQSISNWESTGIQNAQAALVTTTDPATAVLELGKALVETGFIGNSYAQAPSCIRSCIWVPFSYAIYDGTDNIYLGNFDTHVQARKLSAIPTTGSTSVSIPWQFSDWRRAQCETVYLYIPFVGMVNIPSNEIVGVSSLTVNYSFTATDGVICYEVKAGSQVIGTYSGSCAANYPIGINQQASAGEIVQTAWQGAKNTLSSGIQTAKSVQSLDVTGAVGNGIMTGITGIEAVYDTISTSLSSHASCIGGIGGGAGSGLDLSLICFTVAHPTIIAPSAMAATMGLPTMKPMSLSGLTGYCQCANAHVECAAQANELDAIDSYLNSGFFIE